MFAEFVGNPFNLDTSTYLRIKRGFVDLTEIDDPPVPSNICSETVFPTWLSIISILINLVFLFIVIRIPMFRGVAYQCCVLWINSFVQRVRAIVVAQNRGVVEGLGLNDRQIPSDIIELETRPRVDPDPIYIQTTTNPFLSANERVCCIDIEYQSDHMVSRNVPIPGHSVVM